MSGERWVCSFAHPLSPTWSTDLHHCPICGRKRTPTPVPSEVAETTAGEREVEALAKVLAAHVLHAVGGNHWYAECLSEECDWSEQGTGGLIRGIEAHRTHVATVLAALLDRVRREEGERIAQAIEDGCDLPATPCRMCRDAALLARAASVGRGEGA